MLTSSEHSSNADVYADVSSYALYLGTRSKFWPYTLSSDYIFNSLSDQSARYNTNTITMSKKSVSASSAPAPPRDDEEISEEPLRRGGPAVAETQKQDDEESGAPMTIPKVPPTMLFDGSNYSTWAVKFRSLMELYGLWEELDPEEVNEVEGLSDVKKVYSRKSRLAAVVLQSALKSDDVAMLLLDVPTGDARGMWKRLQNHFMKMTPAAAMALKSEFWTIRQKSNESVNEFALRLKACRLKLGAGG